MRVDRVFGDLFDWIKRVLSWKKGEEVVRKPYEVLKLIRGRRGILKLVTRDMPRAVRTYIFSPFPGNQTNVVSSYQKDIHLCLDHLWAIEEEKSKQPAKAAAKSTTGRSQRSRQPFANSHRICVFEASRFMTKDGTYNTNMIYSEDLNLLGNGFHRDQYAVPIMDDLANLLKEFPIDTIDWQVEIESSCKRYLGAHWRPNRSPEPNSAIN